MEKIIQMYSSIPAGENEKMDISVCFSFFITVALMQQHIKKGKEEKTDETSEGFSVIKKKKLSGKYRNDYKIGLFECVLRQWPLRRKKKNTVNLVWRKM